MDVWMTGSATFLLDPAAQPSRWKRHPSGPKSTSMSKSSTTSTMPVWRCCLSWEKLHQSTGGSLTVEWSDLVKRYARRAQDPSQTAIPNLMKRPAA